MSTSCLAVGEELPLGLTTNSVDCEVGNEKRYRRVQHNPFPLSITRVWLGERRHISGYDTLHPLCEHARLRCGCYCLPVSPTLQCLVCRRHTPHRAAEPIPSWSLDGSGRTPRNVLLLPRLPTHGTANSTDFPLAWSVWWIAEHEPLSPSSAFSPLRIGQITCASSRNQELLPQGFAGFRFTCRCLLDACPLVSPIHMYPWKRK